MVICYITCQIDGKRFILKMKSSKCCCRHSTHLLTQEKCSWVQKASVFPNGFVLNITFLAIRLITHCQVVLTIWYYGQNAVKVPI